MKRTSLLLLCLLWSLEEVHSQTAPYLTFMREPLPNHGYVNLSEIEWPGTDESYYRNYYYRYYSGSYYSVNNTVICHTDLDTCCRGADGHGEWYFPNGTALPGAGFNNYQHNSIAIRKLSTQRVRLQRGPVSSVISPIPSGMYRCDIETVAVSDKGGTGRETVYVGVYESGGDIISDNVTLTVDSDLNGASPQFTLTCISTGGPATNVTWTRDSEMLTGSTVLNDTETAQYIHTLTVTGRLGGLYTCTVSNNKPSEDSAQLTVQAPSPPSAVSVSQNGLDSVLVSWTPPSGEPSVTGYIIYYQQDGGERLSQNAVATATTATITGLIAGAAYSIIMVATSSTLPSTETAAQTVSIEPAIISLASSPSSTIVAGHTVTLTCSVTLLTDIPDFRWVGPGVTPTPADPTTSGQMTSSDLTLSDIATSQAGQYTCTATLRGSTFRETIAVNVLIPVSTPSITVSTTGTLYAGTTLSLTCDFTLSTSVDTLVLTAATWMVDGAAVATSPGRISTDVATLSFSPLGTSDTGSYTCEVTVTAPHQTYVTVQGPVQSTEEDITVEIPPPGVDITVSRTAPLYAGTSLTLTCTVTLDPNVDSGESVVTEWSGPRDISGERYSKTAASGSGSTYTGSLTISPLVDQDDGTYTCTGTVTGGTNVQQATASGDVTITVMDLPDPVVTISGPTTGTAGEDFQLTCSVSVVEYLIAQPTVQWSGGSVDSGNGVTQSDTIHSAVMSVRTLTFSSLRTSHGAQYTCQADINIASVSVMKTGSDSSDVMVQIPRPQAMVSVMESELVSGSPLSLTCSIQPRGGSSVDTATTVMSSWSAPNSTYDRENTGTGTSVELIISSVQTADSGDYICSASVTDSSDSVYVVDSQPANNSVTITVKLNVTISANYTAAPDEDPGELGPNEFTAGSVLILNCIVQGHSGELNYTWSVMGNPDTTGCTGCAIDTSSTTSTLRVGNPPLHSYHAGTYTCAVIESGRPDSGNSGDYTVAVVGAGMYARRAASQFDDSPIANNGLVVIASTGIVLDCISNSSQPYVGYITGPEGSIVTEWSPFNRPGVLRIDGNPSQGIYTCTIPDNSFIINVGVYPNGFSMRPTISSLTYQEESRTLTCVSTGSPATIVSWMRDEQPLIIDGSTYHLTQSITDRPSSTYSNVLTVSETAPSGAGTTYICNVTNDLGSDSRNFTAVAITLSGLEQPLTVGRSAIITCMTNVPVSSIEWRDQSSTVLNRATDQTVVDYAILPKDDLQGRQLTCRAVAGTIVYTETVTIQVTVPPGSLEVVSGVSEDSPVEAGSGGLTLTCTIRETIAGLTNMPSAHWMGPSGLVSTEGDGVMTHTVCDNMTATVTVTFYSLHTSHAGEYTCQGTEVTPAGVENVTVASTPNNVTVSLPTPTLDLSVPSGPLYEGTSQTLACSVTLPDTVDTDVTVDVQWTPAASSDRVMISAVSSMRPPFISTLTLSPLSMSDAGQYSCGATADSSSQYITASSQGHSQVEPLTVTALPAPVVTISFSGDSTAGQGYSLQCSASVMTGLVVLPDLKIYSVS